MENNVMRGNDAEMTSAEQAAMSGEGGNGAFAGGRGEGMPGRGDAAAGPGMDGHAGRDMRDAAHGREGSREMGMDRDNMPIEDWSAVELGLPEGVADAAILEDFGRAAVDMGLTPRQARALARWQTEQIARSREQLLENGTRELAKEWGGRMEGNRQAVLSLISRIDRLTGNDSFSRALGESGATCFPGVVRGLLALSRVLSEDSVGAGGVAGSGGAEESAIDGLRNAFREYRRRER